MPGPRKSTVRSTYRVQLHAGFGFDDLAAIAPYLAELGVSHVYCSPYLKAGRGSTHGYDVLAHDQINDELGGPAGHERMCAALDAAGLGQILDIVPNHMAISSPENRWWWDVLKNGQSSRFASFFDIDWDPPESKLRRTILMPILGDHYGRVLKRNELTVRMLDGDPVIAYYDNLAPLSPASVEKFLGDADDGAIARVNSDVDALHELLEAQHYRLAYWRTASTELDYRRFFDINTLVALRQEEPHVFDATHELVLGLVRRGNVHGLRVDHVDGLRDPGGYLAKLRHEIGDGYLIVEKILEPGEELPPAWPVEGTTGYDFLNLAAGLFVDAEAEAALTKTYSEFTSEAAGYEDMVVDKKLLVESELLASDVERLVSLFVDVCEATRDYRDYTRVDLRDVLREALAAFPVYRTYVTAASAATPSDEGYVDAALGLVAERRPDIDGDLLGLLRDVLLMRHAGAAATELSLRFQQTSGPVMAKGVEDTTFYNFNRLVSLNEVGGHPGSIGTSLDEWHSANEKAQARRPLAMLATSTHDTKRSEDVRARINLLSEIPEEWALAVARWSAINERHRRDGMPDRNVEYLLYQTLVGAWPIDVERVVQYVEKASKEAKAHTSWITPNPDYDAALRDFVEGALADRVFVADLEDFVAALVEPGRVSALAQLLLKLTAPGIPDVYQGTELWSSSLVDPDNRRPVDYDERRSLLAEIASLSLSEAWARAESGAPKLLLLWRALKLRNEHPDWFDAGSSYARLHARGDKADHVVAYVRAGSVVAIAPRLVLGVGGDWGDTTIELPPGRWDDALGGAGSWFGAVRVSDVLGAPVALLAKASS
jgi:(1->4)-alpha-D-glucan 1-alpha-D-glucosylmutase